MDGEISVSELRTLLDDSDERNSSANRTQSDDGDGRRPSANQTQSGDGDERNSSANRSQSDDGDAPTVVDIRQPPAFRRGHIPGSVNVPFRQLPDRVAELTDADHVVTVCPHGKSSVQAARLIASYEGTSEATVESLAGGLSEWDGDLEQAVETGGDEGPEAPF